MAQGRPASVPATDDLLRLSARLPAQQKPSTAGAWPLTVRRVFVNLLLAVQDILGGLALVFQRRQVDMTTVDHELTFCSDAAGWMNAELSSRPELAFGQVKIEQSARGSAKRRDLTIYDRSGKIAITGEVKLPYMVDGSSPYNEKVVEDAHTKASRVGAAYFITWNVNRIVLWRTDDAGKPLFERHVYEDSFTQVRDADDLVNPVVQQAIRRGLVRLLERASQAYTGALPLAKRPLDEFFIGVLEAALERPIAVTQRAVGAKYQRDGKFKAKLDAWMRDTQQWHLSDDELVQRDNLDRASKFACYVLVNKIVFYQALRKKFTTLPQLRLGAGIKTAADLEAVFAKVFERAERITRDYETVFDGDFGDALPFLSDDVVPPWRDLVKSIDQFDFTQINYDVIGPIFERLISPEERHRYGQHYTKPEIVDLIEAFCIRAPDAAVLDPACGGGTFLVRAYNRKKFLAARAGVDLPHEKMLDQLYGVDISAYATHLTTMNLATRDLIDEHNYPLVAQSDFFDVERGRALFHVPMAAGAGSKQLRPVMIGTVDAVVGNPPYVRQEEISTPPTTSAKGKVKVTVRTLEQIKAEATAYKKRLLQLARAAWPQITLSGRSDLHIYFWPHATTFLKPGGHYGFLTSSGWLDVEYGFRLQEFLLNHYAIVAIFESQVEPWFTGARITTCATILRREPDAKRRDENLVRFVRLHSPLSEIFPSDATEEDRQLAAEALRDRIERITQNSSDRHWRVRVVQQGDLYRLGCHTIAGDSDGDGEPDEGNGTSAVVTTANGSSPYRGGKWGLYVRAPDLFFKFQERYGGRLVPLSEVAEVRFGVKTGADKFFFVRDITDECLKETPDPREFRAKYGIQPVQGDRMRIVKAGDGSAHLIEAAYLEPQVHNLMENNGVFGIRIRPEDLRLKIVLCSKSKDRLKNTHILKYIQWGEREGFHTRPTCASREPWYDVKPGRRGDMFWPMAQQYRHLAPLNDPRLICNHNLFDVFARKDIETKVLCGILNSTVVAMMKHLFGRLAGTEGNLKTEVVDAKMMVVPDPRTPANGVKQRIIGAVEQMARRQTRNLPDEFELADRQQLDDAVLELLGENDPNERRWLRDELYREMTAMYRAIRDKELQMIEYKKQTKRGSKLSAERIAQEVWDSLDPSLVRRFPEDFFDPNEPADAVELRDGKCRLVDNSLLGQVGIDIDGHYIEVGDVRRAHLVKAILESGRRGRVPIPCDGDLCRTTEQRYRSYCDQVAAEFAHLTAQKTANEKLQAKVVTNLRHRLAHPDGAPPCRTGRSEE